MTWLSDAALASLRDAADRPDLSGTRYELLDLVGRGGMGAVYRALDRELGREVALKVVDGVVAPDAAGRLLREARILARLEHPGIVPVHDVGTLPDGRTFYVMKFVRGVGLDAAVKADTPLGERLRLFSRACEAVAFAHARGIVHRDLKPANVMTGPFGEVLVLDWGVARVLAEPDGTAVATPAGSDTAPLPKASSGASRGDSKKSEVPAMPVEGDLTVADRSVASGASLAPTTLASAGNQGGVSARRNEGDRPVRHAGRPCVETREGDVLGTPGFMPPEQASGRHSLVDERADVYALGALLDWMVRSGGGRVSSPIQAVVSRAMATDPDARYGSVEALAEDVARFNAGLAVQAHRETLRERAVRLFVRHKTPILLVLAYLLMRVVLLLARP